MKSGVTSLYHQLVSNDKNILWKNIILGIDDTILGQNTIESLKNLAPISFINTTLIDHSVINNDEFKLTSDSFLVTLNCSTKITTDRSNHIKISPIISHLKYTFSLGHQRHLRGNNIPDNKFGTVSSGLSLGQLRYHIEVTEPIFRQCECTDFSLSALRIADIPGEQFACPTGLYTEEACQLTRYCGESIKMKHLNIESKGTETNIKERAQVIATMIWYAFEGRSKMKFHTPQNDLTKYHTYILNIDSSNITIIFYKNKMNGKWWASLEDHDQIIPCSFSDYSTCLKGQLSNYLTYTLVE